MISLYINIALLQAAAKMVMPSRKDITKMTKALEHDFQTSKKFIFILFSITRSINFTVLTIAANGALRALVGNVVVRNITNQHSIQSRPRKFKQTVATKKASTDFGRASNAGGLVRAGLSDTHLDLYDSNMVSRLNGQILRAMRPNPDQVPGKMSLQHGKLHRLANFQFNEKSNTQDYLNFDIELFLNENNLLAIEIPRFKKDRDIKFLDTAGKMIVVINAMAIDFVKAASHIVSYSEIEINCK